MRLEFSELGILQHAAPQYAARLRDAVEAAKANPGELILLPTGAKICHIDGKFVVSGYADAGRDVLPLWQRRSKRYSTDSQATSPRGEAIAGRM